MVHNDIERIDDFPVIPDIRDFDRSSGNWLERLIFNYRWAILLGCILVTSVLGFMASKLVLNASFDKMIPQSHPYIKNYMANKKNLGALGNALLIVVENTKGDIFNPEYLDALMHINDEVFLMPGVDRPWVRSLWTPTVRWIEITEEGFVGGPVMPMTYDGSQESLEQLKQNIARAGILDKLVARDMRSSVVLVPLMESDPQTGKRLDYGKFTAQIDDMRHRYEEQAKGSIKIHITGFAKIVGDLIKGLRQVMVFFGLAILICAVVIFFYTHCVRSTIVLIMCALCAVLCQLGIVTAMGFELDPYQVLVPFLVFAIGASHGAQKMNGIMQDIGRGTHKLVAARYTFRRLFRAGLMAILADAVSFAVLMFIDIPVIRELVMTASIGVAILIYQVLILLPVVLSFTGVSAKAAKRSLAMEDMDSSAKGAPGALWRFLVRFTERRWAIGSIAVAALITGIGFIISQDLQIGDVDPGAPELRPDSVYNRDSAFVNAKYGYSSDQFAVMVKTPPDGIIQYRTLIEIDRLSWILQQTPGVLGVATLADLVRQTTAGTYDGSPKWLTLCRNQEVLNYGANRSIENNPDMANPDLTFTPVIAYLSDHKAATLDRVAQAAESFSKIHSDKGAEFVLAAGSAGIDAATNNVVQATKQKMMLLVYSVVALLCMIAFRSWRATLVALIPLLTSSILCEAIMVKLGIGLKVATLPVIALGVGIGVDYALYLMSVFIKHRRSGLSLHESYWRALRFTGKVVFLVGLTMAFAVVTWAWSPIKFQADMGILLTFMFLWNMIGALILIPALSLFLLGDKLTAKASGTQVAISEQCVE